jgi:O-antigen chain-terminating methyltransferase
MNNYQQGIYALPIIGRLLRWAHRIATLGRLENRLTLSIDQARQQAQQQAQQMILEQQKNLLEHLDARVESLRAEMAHALSNQRNDWKATLATNSRALEATARALAGMPLSASAAPSRLSSPESYLKFEDAFRGQWKVEERVRWYMPHVQEVFTTTGTRKPCLDIGCGRGEFMLALKRNQFSALGIDLNPAMADTARAKGLEVVLADALSHLVSLDPGSLAVVSAFHLVEHLPFDQTLHLIEAAYRVLTPGGLLILETPNPENLVVGGCTFWYDPTHIRPLPPAMLRFYVESAGFSPVKTARFYLRTDGPDHATLDEPVLPSVDGPLDYGLLAIKPR